MKRLWIILFLITGCATIPITTDYLGNEVNLNDGVMSLKEILQDPTDENVMFLTFEIRSRLYVRSASHDISLRKYIWLVAKDNGFIAWQVVNTTVASDMAENWAIDRFVYEVRFSRSEEDFDKWNERLKK